ncbi:MAG: hypothetical protein IPG64_21275 [Haliea sp.]|nr:hypothetical protein [Haliea sp.]
MTDVRLIHGNSARMAEVADAEATLILTSPPYFSDADEPRLRSGRLRDGEIAALTPESGNSPTSSGRSSPNASECCHRSAL